MPPAVQPLPRNPPPKTNPRGVVKVPRRLPPEYCRGRDIPTAGVRGCSEEHYNESQSPLANRGPGYRLLRLSGFRAFLLEVFRRRALALSPGPSRAGWILREDHSLAATGPPLGPRLVRVDAHLSPRPCGSLNALVPWRMCGLSWYQDPGSAPVNARRSPPAGAFVPGRLWRVD